MDSEELLDENGHMSVTTAVRYTGCSKADVGLREARRSSVEGQEGSINSREGESAMEIGYGKNVTKLFEVNGGGGGGAGGSGGDGGVVGGCA